MANGITVCVSCTKASMDQQGEFGSEPISDFVYVGNSQSYCFITQ